MQRDVNLIDLGFQNFSVEEKRKIFMILDIVMKKYHDKGYMITSFDPKDIYYQDEIFSFSKYSRISPINTDDKNDAVLNNVIGLSNLAFCSYLPQYDFTRGILNSEAVKDNYDKFENIFIPFDRQYYRSVLVDSINKKQLPEIPYYYDYVNSKMKDSNLADRKNSNSLAYVKATEIGKLMSDKNNEGGFGTTFYLACMLSSTLIALIGLGIYFFR